MEKDHLDPPVHLYIKTHELTGLKYFGRTVKDPFKYRGSGIHWTRHLEKHGDKVTTEIYGTFYSKKKLIESAVGFSLQNDIVLSSN